MIIKLEAPKGLEDALNALHKQTIETPKEIQAKAETVLKFCRDQLPDDGQVYKFPLGRVHVDAGLWTRLTIKYTLEYSAKWESCYHDDSIRRERSIIRSEPSFNCGIFEQTTSTEK